MESIVKKAVVLAAGFGTRLKPFTCTRPKPLLPVWGVPMIERIVEMLRSRGVDDIVVNAHHLHGQIEAWVDAYRRRALESGEKFSISVSFEPEILGSAGALNPLRGWIGNDPFYLVNSDIVIENAPKLELSGEADEIGVCLAVATGPRTVEVEPVSGYITNWRSEDAGCEGTFTYCGMAIYRPEILGYVKDGFSSIVTAAELAAADGKFVRAVTDAETLWEDAGTVESYIDLNRDGEDNAFADIPHLKSVLGDDPRPIRFLGIRGSERMFFRSGGSIVIVYDDGNRKENHRYASHAKYLRAKGIPVPEVQVENVSLRTVKFEYAGSERKMSVDDYAEVIKALVKFNALGSSGDLPELEIPFSPVIWKWERELFSEHCLKARFGLELTEEVERELAAVADVLEREPRALVHRDCQSTNILWKNGVFSFIDFQGMRLGPAVYDLASLVYDPYVELTDKARRALAALYGAESGRAETVSALPYAAVQRLVQCLGAYGRLAAAGHGEFVRHILPALTHLLSAADEAGLDAVGALAEDLIAKEEKMHR